MRFQNKDDFEKELLHKKTDDYQGDEGEQLDAEDDEAAFEETTRGDEKYNDDDNEEEESDQVGRIYRTSLYVNISNLFTSIAGRKNFESFI